MFDHDYKPHSLINDTLTIQQCSWLDEASNLTIKPVTLTGICLDTCDFTSAVIFELEFIGARFISCSEHC